MAAASSTNEQLQNEENEFVLKNGQLLLESRGDSSSYFLIRGNERGFSKCK